MTRRTTSIVTTAAAMVFSAGLVFSQAQSGGSREAGQNQTPSGQSSQSAAGAAGVGNAARMQSSQDVDQLVSSQLREIAKDPKTAGDKLFVLGAAMGNQMEIEFARQAQQKAQNPQVKNVAQHIMEDHQKANDQLKPIAQQLGLQLPQGLPDDKQQKIQIIASMPTEEFEKCYITMMQADHAKDLIEYRAHAMSSKDAQVKNYAQQTVPVLASHRDMVMQAAMALGMPANSSDAIPASGRMDGSTGSVGQMNGMTPANRTSDGIGSPGSSNTAADPTRSGNTPRQP